VIAASVARGVGESDFELQGKNGRVALAGVRQGEENDEDHEEQDGRGPEAERCAVKGLVFRRSVQGVCSRAIETIRERAL